MNFSKHNKMALRTTKHGQTMYAMVTVRDEMLIQALKSISERNGKSPTAVLGKFIQAAFDSGLTPG